MYNSGTICVHNYGHMEKSTLQKETMRMGEESTDVERIYRQELEDREREKDGKR